MSPLSDILLEVYGRVGTTPAARFRRTVLEIVRCYLPFDSALWGSFTLEPGGARAHSGTLYGLPDQMMVDYQDIKQHDWLNLQSVAAPGTTFNVSAEQIKDTVHPLALSHMRKYGMEHTLCTAFAEPKLNLWTAIALYRGPAGCTYTEEERELKQALVPHVVQAWHLNAIHAVSDRDAHEDLCRTRALVDAHGLVHATEPGLAQLLCREWEGWEGPRLPDSVAEAVATDGAFRGRTVSVHTLGRFDQLTLIEVREAAAVDQLTPRQRAVAEAFATGQTYREIAASLGTSPATIRNHLQAVYEKLGVSSKIELARRLEAIPP